MSTDNAINENTIKEDTNEIKEETNEIKEETNEINEEPNPEVKEEKQIEKKVAPIFPEEEGDEDLSALSFSSYDSIDNEKLDKMGQYTCDLCSEIPKILGTNLKNRTILIKCKTHGQRELDIKNYLLNALNHNTKNWKCSMCDKIQRNFKDNFVYCCECTCVFCHICYPVHQVNEKHKNKIESDKYDLRCKNDIDHFEEPYTGYCYECHTNYCQKCEEKHSLHSVTDINSMYVDENAIKNIRNINKEYRSLISYYESLIRLNNLIIYSYQRYPDNYYNCYNINTIINNVKRNEIIKPMNEIESKVIDPGEKGANLYKYINSLYKKELKEEETEAFELDNQYFNDYDLKVLTQLPLKNLHLLVLENNCIRNIDCIKNAEFPDLVILNLNNNAIEDISPLENIKFVEFQALLLRNNNIQDISIFGRVNFEYLREIDLRNNRIDDIEVFEKHKLKMLQCLYLTYNDFNSTDKRFEKVIKKLRDELIESEFSPEDAKEEDVQDQDQDQDQEQEQVQNQETK